MATKVAREQIFKKLMLLHIQLTGLLNETLGSKIRWTIFRNSSIPVKKSHLSPMISLMIFSKEKLGLSSIDHQIILYGAANSAFEKMSWGGLSANPSMHLQNAMDIEEMDRDSDGNWRIFSATDISSYTKNGETFHQEWINRYRRWRNHNSLLSFGGGCQRIWCIARRVLFR